MHPTFLPKMILHFTRCIRQWTLSIKKLWSSGVGAQKQPTETFSKEEENTLWESGVLGTDNPKSLLRAVFFGNGKNFRLRGGSEHRDLRLSQIQQTAEWV